MSACGQKSSNAGSSVGVSPLSTYDNMQLSDLNLVPLVCANTSLCPKAIGQIVIVTSVGPARCTATLVGSNVILTASHCVPWESVERDQTIHGHCWFRTVDGQSAPCGQVLKASHLSTTSAVQEDYAYIELKAGFAASPLKVADPRSLRDAWPVQEPQDSSGKAIHGYSLFVARVGTRADRIERLPCRPEPHAILKNRSWDPEQVRVFSECEVVHGDSGAPLLDSKWEIRGVVSLFWPSQSSASPRAAPRLLSVVTRPQPL